MALISGRLSRAASVCSWYSSSSACSAESEDKLLELAYRLTDAYPQTQFNTSHCTGDSVFATLQRVMGDKIHAFSCGTTSSRMMSGMETERILLRPWLESDAETLFKYASDPEVGPRAGWPPHKSVEESLEIIRTVFNAEGMWAVIWKESGEAIGCVGYLPASASNLKIAEDHAEVGYWIARPFWGKGICTEALQMVIDYCFSEKGFTTLWGDYFPSNPASGRVMEKCGFVDTGKETLCPNLEVGSDRPVRIMQLKQ